MTKVFYDKTQNFEVVDLTGLRTLAEITKQFPGNYVELSYDNNSESVEYVNDTPVKFNLQVRLDAIRASKQNERNRARTAIKNKLGLTDEQIDDLTKI